MKVRIKVDGVRLKISTMKKISSKL
jgi:hypothetical protein